MIALIEKQYILQQSLVISKTNFLVTEHHINLSTFDVIWKYKMSSIRHSYGFVHLYMETGIIGLRLIKFHLSAQQSTTCTCPEGNWWHFSKSFTYCRFFWCWIIESYIVVSTLCDVWHLLKMFGVDKSHNLISSNNKNFQCWEKCILKV